jgi:hypothetical protein
MSNRTIKLHDILREYPNINQVIINSYTYQEPHVFEIYIKYDDTDNFLKLIVQQHNTDTGKLYTELENSWDFL